MARAEKRSTRPFTGRLDTRSLDALQRLADADQRSVTFVIQQAVDEYLAHRKGKAARAPKSATAAPDDDANPFK
jgi:predicted transcriptional regulator